MANLSSNRCAVRVDLKITLIKIEPDVAVDYLALRRILEIPVSNLNSETISSG